MPYYGITSELRRIVGLSIICIIIGLLLGSITIALSAGALLYIGYHLHNIRRLLKCLQGRRLKTIPDASGLWGQVFDHLSRLKRREIREKNKLKGVINRVDATTAALNDAVILLKGSDLSWWNKATESLLDLKKGDSGSSIINFIRNPKFVSYLEKGDYSIPLTLPSPRNNERQLEFQITRFGQEEALVVVRDITRIYKLEQMRKDFVANVSHELRTPLTVIRGYLETLEDSRDPSLESSPHWQKAMKQMQQQAARMTTLINDLTMLSKLETDPSGKDNESEVVLKPLLDMICNDSRTISGERNQTIQLSCNDTITLLGNDRELHSAFSNLVTNAIKYSAPEKTINISVTINLAGNLVVQVKDEGIGIEQEHISRLTERFYRIDSSRSIQTGGTGLGLAIVKHILLRHDARLQIDSIYNQGSTFSCIFPSSRLIKQ
ncbi:MAG: phosphate regulon sensor histidine kinase PhoR [Cellvibrionaceae bacterium]